MGVSPRAPVGTAGGPGASYYFSRMNQERADNGRAPFAWASDLESVANRWAAHMAASQTLSHNPNLRSEVSNWRAVGENVGEGGSIDDLDRAFWNSSEHRANILDSEFEQVGVGSVQQDDIIWIAIVFRDPMHSSYSAPPSQPAPTTTSTSTTTSAPAPKARPHFVAMGDRGHRVSRVQRLLALGSTNGVFDRRTRHAVRLFQRSFGLPVDGKVGPRTLTWLHIVRAKFRASALLVRHGVRLPTTGVKGAPPLGCMTRFRSG